MKNKHSASKLLIKKFDFLKQKCKLSVIVVMYLSETT
jgi:hypothetical protein